MVEESSKKIAIIIVIGLLAVLSFFILKSFIVSIISGLLLAFIFSPLYEKIHKFTKIRYRGLTAFLFCVFFLLIIILILWFATPILLKESFKLYDSSKNIDFVTPLKKIFPSIFESEKFSTEVGNVLYSFVLKITNSISLAFTDIILNFPSILLNLFIIFFTFFYTLKDKEIFVQNIKDLFPFSKDIEKKFFDSTRDITFSIIYGQFIIGTIQGIILSIGIFLFKAPNPLLLSLLAVLVGIMPIIGPSLVGIPLAIYFLINQNTVSALGILTFTGIASISDNLIRPYFVAKKTKIYPPLILFGMLGGYSFLGLIGLIIGPLILYYLIILLEIYKNKTNLI
jgi:predicted PurR-regulated permease PerM